MCGLAGFCFNGINSLETRRTLIREFGIGIDTRGGNAAGFVSLSENGDIDFNRVTTTWEASSPEFQAKAASGTICMMHSRAPGFGAPVTDAHPFPIQRNGETVLWGAHNGSLNEAWSSARKNGRTITVDSMEVFELLADNELEALQNMHGYGVITWVEADDPFSVKLTKLTRDGNLVAASLIEGGVAWASTWGILNQALAAANLHVNNICEVNEVGRVYRASKDSIVPTPRDGVRLYNYTTSY